MTLPNPLSFEEAFSRLETILEKINTGTLSLDESLLLYEEADRLIQQCNERLVQAEHKIEMLTKNRESNLMLSEKGAPLTEAFASSLNLKKANADE